MPKARQSTREPFVEVGYEDKIVFTPQARQPCAPSPARHLAAESGPLDQPPGLSRYAHSRRDRVAQGRRQ